MAGAQSTDARAASSSSPSTSSRAPRVTSSPRTKDSRASFRTATGRRSGTLRSPTVCTAVDYRLPRPPRRNLVGGHACLGPTDQSVASPGERGPASIPVGPPQLAQRPYCRAQYPPLTLVAGRTVALMPRPRTYEEPRLATAVRLPASLHLRLRAEARDRQVSANLLVEWAITDFLDRLPALQSTLGTPK
jgi:hypothetical protein